MKRPRAPRRPLAGDRTESAREAASGDWRRANAADLRVLHGRYLAQSDEPFFLEISGPDLGMPLARFVDWCTDDAVMWIAVEEEGINGFLWFSYIQSEIGVANVDWSFFSEHPRSRARASGIFSDFFDERCRELGLRKVHLYALLHQTDRIDRAKRLGFVEEGTLSGHFFHAGRLQDVLCFGRLAP